MKELFLRFLTLREKIVRTLKTKSVCDFGGIGDFHDKDEPITLSCYLKNPEELADLVLEIIKKEERNGKNNFS